MRYVVTGEGNGPVNALDAALREAIGQAFPEVAKFELIDYKVRILDQGHGTDAITRVLIETTDGESSWVTVGVGANVIEASWGALVDGLTFGLRRQHHAEPRRRDAQPPTTRRTRSSQAASIRSTGMTSRPTCCSSDHDLQRREQGVASRGRSPVTPSSAEQVAHVHRREGHPPRATGSGPAGGPDQVAMGEVDPQPRVAEGQQPLHRAARRARGAAGPPMTRGLPRRSPTR